ncbi:MAG: HAMP domain-containing histidine kinase, partial [Rhodospirillales bacterium]|nr:HAMP domain-containing histidine kinase [Rhodospirillales bacterium]
LERLVGDMLSLSEVEAGSFELKLDDVRLIPLFEELELEYKAQAREKELKVSFDLPPKLPVLQADIDKLKLALHNVVGNAVKYTPARGSVSVSVEEDQDTLVVEVRDTGPGIPLEEQEHIFEKFYRTAASRENDVQGSGLGLTLARELIRLHGGDIIVSSRPGEGCTFTLSLPCGQVTE